MSLISSGSSRAIRSVGRSRISSSEARSISRTRKAFASSSLERSTRARGPRMGVMGRRSVRLPNVLGGNTILPPKTAEPGRNLHRTAPRANARPWKDWRHEQADCDRRGARGGCSRRSGRSARRPWSSSARSAACSPRSWPRPGDVPPFDSSAMDGFALVAGPRRRAARGGRVARRPPLPERGGGGRRGAHLHRRGGSRGRRRGRAGGAHRGGRRAACGCRRSSRARTSAARARTCAPARWCSGPA